MEEIKQSSNSVHVENDKQFAPFLLAASFQNLIQFQGSYTDKGILYWQFSPRNTALQLIQEFRTKTNPNIPARDLFDAIETFWKQISERRNEGMKYGNNYR